MKIIYAKEKIKKDIEKKNVFLAGPSPRNKKEISWRKEAIQIFKENQFKGTLFVPEEKNETRENFNYLDQIEWEEEALNKADIILFWIPRGLNKFQGFTTNIEWGYWTAKNPSKLVLGSPKNTPKMRYLNYYADKLNIPRFENLENLIKFVIGEKNEY
jgi:nucleoside 2-deoxyribosyltransferase